VGGDTHIIKITGDTIAEISKKRRKKSSLSDAGLCLYPHNLLHQ
jgi:hypothetical protein